MDVTINKTQVLELGNRASDAFIRKEATSLNDAIVEVVGSTPYNRLQLARVVQAANQSAWAKLASVKDPSTVRFEPADVDQVLTSLRKSTSVKTASRLPLQIAPPTERLEQILGIAPDILEKTAEETTRKFYEGSWSKLASLLEQASRKVTERHAQVSNEAFECFRSLVKEAIELRRAGVAEDVLREAVKRASASGEGLVLLLEKEAFAKTREISISDLFGQAPAPLNAILEPGEIRTEAPPDWEMLNRDHPVIKLASRLHELREEQTLLKETERELSGRAREARQLEASRAPRPSFI